jgi:hypothetical protein
MNMSLHTRSPPVHNSLPLLRLLSIQWCTGSPADAAHACREAAEYIAGKKQGGNRESDYFLFVKANQAGLQRAIFNAIRRDGPRP